MQYTLYLTGIFHCIAIIRFFCKIFRHSPLIFLTFLVWSVHYQGHCGDSPLLYSASPLLAKCCGVKGSMYKVMKSFICRGCSNPVISTCHTSVDIGVSANLEAVDKFCYLGEFWVWMEMMMQPWRPESELDGINSGSWYHCLPMAIYHWSGEGGCIAVACEVVCYTEVRPGLSGRKWGGTSASRDENGQMDV